MIYASMRIKNQQMKIAFDYLSFGFLISVVDCPLFWCVRTMMKRTFRLYLMRHFGMVSAIQPIILGYHRPHTVLRYSHSISCPIARYYSHNRYSMHSVHCYFVSIFIRKKKPIPFTIFIVCKKMKTKNKMSENSIGSFKLVKPNNDVP